MVDFSKHHCSADVKAFLDVDAQIAASPDSTVGGGDDSPVDDISAPSEGRASMSRRGSVRRQSLQQSGR